MEEYYSRGFKGHRKIEVASEIVARDLGISVRTLLYHNKIGEFAGLIRRVRMGQGNVTLIYLTLRPVSGRVKDLSMGIKAQLPNIHPVLFENRPRTMKWWLKQIARHEAAMRPIRGRKPKCAREEYVA